MARPRTLPYEIGSPNWVARKRAYYSWFKARQRCNNPRQRGYERYGGRGISVCERWNSFETFLADMGLPPPGTSIDRIDNDGNYEPANCRWATPRQQMRNRNCNRRIEAFGEVMTVSAAAERFGIGATTISHRLDKGYEPERAVTEPLHATRTGRPRGVPRNATYIPH